MACQVRIMTNRLAEGGLAIPPPLLSRTYQVFGPIPPRVCPFRNARVSARVHLFCHAACEARTRPRVIVGVSDKLGTEFGLSEYITLFWPQVLSDGTAAAMQARKVSATPTQCASVSRPPTRFTHHTTTPPP